MTTNEMPAGAGYAHGQRTDNGRRAAAVVAGKSSTKRRAAQVRLTNMQGKTCGTLDGDTLYKTVSSAKHRLRIPPAWALDLDHIEQAEQHGVLWVQLHDTDDSSTWRASLADFRTYGYRLDRGHGVQLALTLDHWTHRVPGAPVQLALL